MALTINTNITNDVTEYLVDDRAVKGGYKVVSGEGTDTKEKLPAATTVEGTLVYDVKEKKAYRYTNGAWVEETGSGGTSDYEDLINAPITRVNFLDEAVGRTIDVTFDATEKSATLTMNLDVGAGSETQSKTVQIDGTVRATLGGLQIVIALDDNDNPYYSLSVETRNGFYMINESGNTWDVYMHGTEYGFPRVLARGTEDVSFTNVAYYAPMSVNTIYQYTGVYDLGTSSTAKIEIGNLYGWTTGNGVFLFAMTQQQVEEILNNRHTLYNPSGNLKVDLVDRYDGGWNAAVISATNPSDIEASTSVKFVVEGSGPGRLGYQTTLWGNFIEMGKGNLKYSVAEYVPQADAADWFYWLDDGQKYSGIWLGGEEAATVLVGNADRPYYIKGGQWDDEGWRPKELALVDDIQANPTEAATETDNLTKLKIQDKIYNLGGGGTNVVANPEAEATSVVQKITIGETVYSILPAAYEEYLKKATFVVPEISLSLYDESDTKISGGTYETGTTFTVASFHHKETNLDSIQGNTMTFYKGSTAYTTSNKSTTAVTVDLDGSEITIDSNMSFKLSCTDTLGTTRSSSTISFTFADYAYSATSTEATAPTSGTKKSTIATFANSGDTFSYTAGGYLYLYVKDTGKTVEIEVLGQWADTAFTEMDGITFTKANGATDTYVPYRVGPFAKTGSAKYRVK